MYNVIYKMSDGSTKSIAKELTYSRAYSLVVESSTDELVSVSSTNMGTVLRFKSQSGYYILEKIEKSDIRLDQYA